MKKFYFTVLFLLFGLIGSVEAQTYKFYSTDFAMKYKTDRGYWSDWSDWEPSHCLITISLDRDEISIYSEEIQEFDVIRSDDWRKDNGGGEQFEMFCIDSNGLKCSMRLRVQSNGELQLYVEYNDLMYVYHLERKN